MDDNNKKQSENQSLYETVPLDNHEENLNEPQIEVEETPEEVQSTDFQNESSVNAGSELPPPVYMENKNQYLIIAILGIVFFIFFVIIIKSIFFSGSKNKKPVVLNYWGLWEDEQIFQPIINEYQQKNPHVKINYKKMSPENYREKIIARSKNGEGPDIFRFHNTWLPEIKEVVSPLPPQIMSNNEFEKTFYKIHQKDLKIGDYYYGLPLMIDGLVLVYNDSLFKKAGITLSPKNWDDISEIVPKLTVKDSKGNLITAGIAIGTTNNVEHFSDIFGLLLVQNGVNGLDKIDQTEAAGALEAYRRLAEPQSNYWNELMPNSITAFVQEKVAMIIVPSWEILSIKSANPELKIKVVPVPFLPGSSPVSLANYWVEGVSKYSKNQIEAWKFLKYLTEKETMTKLYEIQSKFRLFGEPYSRVDLGQLLVQNEYLGAVIKQADYYVSLPLISRTYDNGLNDEIIQYLENAINSTAQGVSYSEALKNVSQGIKQVLSKYNISF